MLSRKYKKARLGVQESRCAYVGLTDSLEEQGEKLKKWRDEEERAMQDRGDALTIFNVKMEKAATTAEIRLALTLQEAKPGQESGTVAWLSNGISIEQSQCV